MSYISVANMAEDTALRRRITACVATQDESEPETWAMVHRWELAAQPGWAEKWDAAQAGDIANPGADPSVITDADILSAVQAIRLEEFVPPKDTKGA